MKLLGEVVAVVVLVGAAVFFAVVLRIAFPRYSHPQVVAHDRAVILCRQLANDGDGTSPWSYTRRADVHCIHVAEDAFATAIQLDQTYP